MRNLTKVMIATAAGLVLLIGAGCSQPPEEATSAEALAAAVPAVDEESPEFAAMEYRHGVMHVMAFKAGTIRDMAEGTIAVDDAVFTEYAADLAAVSGMIAEGFAGFTASSSDDLPDSTALAAIWSDWDGFLDKAAALQTAAAELAALAADGGFAAAQDAAGDLSANCGGCHRNYRVRPNR